MAGAAGSYTVTARAIDNQGASSTSSVQINVSNPANPTLLRAPDAPSGALDNGVSYDYFTFESLTDLNSVTDLVGTPKASGFLSGSPSLAPAESDPNNFNNYGLIYTGYIDAPEDGIYTFSTTSNDGNDLFIGNQRIIDNDGQHAATEVSAEIGLRAGLHQFTLRYYQSGGSVAFTNAWQGPGFAKEIIPSQVWFTQSSGVNQPVPNVEPTVTLSSPLGNSEFTAGAAIAISADASDADGSVAQVEFLVNGTSLGNADTAAPYIASFASSEPGTYTISAIATDNNGAISSDQITVVVRPQVIVDTPSDLTEAVVVSGPLTQGIAYDYFKVHRPSSTDDLVGESDESGILAAGPSVLPATNDATSIDYGFIYRGFINVPDNGIYTFYTNSDDGSDLFIGDNMIVDNDGSHGAQERSGEIGLEAGLHPITIRYFQGRSSSFFEYSWQGPSFAKEAIPAGVWFVETDEDSQSEANVGPSVAITSPSANSTFTTGTAILITANASDQDGAISLVEFLLNGDALDSSDLSAPYIASFTPTNVGNYIVSVVAHDNEGATTTAQVEIEVNSPAIIDTPTGLRDAVTPTGPLTGGVGYDYFKIHRPSSTSDLVGQPDESGILIEGPSVEPANQDSTSIDYGFIYTGYINIPESGVYTFYTRSDDGSDLFIGDELIVDNDGSHGAQERSGDIALEAGLHPITIRYFQGRSSSVFEYAWQGPSFAKETIPANVWLVESSQAQAANDALDEPIQAIQDNNGLVNGVNYDYFKFIRVSSTNELLGTPHSSGLLPLGPSLVPAVNDSNSKDYGFIFTGYIEVTESGSYTFYTTSDDGSDLFIGGRQIVNNDGNHPARERSGQVNLEAGLHPITVRYFQGRSLSEFALAWQGPNFTKQVIPQHVWFTNDID